MTYYQQNVLAQLKTDTSALSLVSTTNAIVTTSTVTMSATATNPRASGRTSSQWFDTDGLCYMRIIPFIENSGSNTVTTPVIRVIGWSYSTPSALWIPMILCEVAVTLSTIDVTINSVSMRQPTVLVRQQGDGKTLSSDTTHVSGAGMVVDTLGCQFVELSYRAASKVGDPVANAFYASI